MVGIVFAIVVISLIAAVLAALLVVSEHFLANYGECEIAINDEKRFTVKGGGPLLEALSRQKIFIPSACGGRGTCGYCKVKVLEGAGTVLPTEAPFLSEEEKANLIRLSCMVKIRNAIRIEIPAELLAVREYTGVCREIRDLTHDMKHFRIELQEPESIEFIPGQYVQLLAPAYGDNTEEVYRAYSIASDPKQKNIIDLIIRLVPGGICTTYCFEYLKVGDTVKFNGPYGEFHLSDSDAPMVFVAGGSGMAPMRCLLHHMENNHIARPTVYYFGANRVKELCLLDEMKRFESVLANYRFVPVVLEPEEKWDGQTGLVTQALERDLTNAAGQEAYLCGSPGMIDASIVVLKKLGISENKIYFDKF